MNVFNRQWLAQRPYVIAIAISVFLVFWMMSGSEQQMEQAAENNTSNEMLIPKVKVETFVAERVHKTVELYGRTEPDRTSTIKAEVPGRVDEVLAKRGSVVKKGQVIARIAMNDLASQLARSRALLVQRELQFSGAQSLHKDGYQGKVQLATAEADLVSVKADITRLEIDIENTIIRAPFDGVLNTRYVEEGDYVKNGDKVAMVADLDEPEMVADLDEPEMVTELDEPEMVADLDEPEMVADLDEPEMVADLDEPEIIEPAKEVEANELPEGKSADQLVEDILAENEAEEDPLDEFNLEDFDIADTDDLAGSEKDDEDDKDKL